VKKLIVFDLDGTLAESKASLDAEMAVLFNALLSIVKVAVIPEAIGRSLRNKCSPIFRMMTTLKTCLFFLPAERSLQVYSGLEKKLFGRFHR